MMALIGLVFAATAWGYKTDLTEGCLVFGLGLIAMALLDGTSRMVVRLREGPPSE